MVRSVGIQTDGTALHRQFHLDNQGSVQALTTGSQSVETHYKTDAWGNVLTGNVSDNHSVYLGGLGYWQEPTLGLNYVRARWLEPQTGSWLSVDARWDEPRYSYAHNSPALLTDPSGMAPDAGFHPIQQVKDFAARQYHAMTHAAKTALAHAVEGLAKSLVEHNYDWYKQWYPQQPRQLQVFFPDPDANPGNPAANKAHVSQWIAEFTMAYAEGFFGEVKGFFSGVWDKLEKVHGFMVSPALGMWMIGKDLLENCQEAWEFFELVAQEYKAFESAGFTVESFFVTFIMVPLMQEWVALTMVTELPPAVLGRLAGMIAFQILVQVIIQLAAACSYGFAELAQLAELGQLGRIGEQLVALRRAVEPFMKAKKEVQAVRKEINALKNGLPNATLQKLAKTAQKDPHVSQTVAKAAELLGLLSNLWSGS